MRGLLLLLFCFTLMGVNALAQVYHKTVGFSIATTYLEPDGRDLAVKVSDQEFVTLAKTKGSVMGPSNYVLEKMSKEFKSMFKVNWVAEPEEDFFRMVVLTDTLRLFSVVHNARTSMSQCKVYDFNLADGTLRNSNVIAEHPVKKWYSEPTKATVSENFNETIASGQPRGFVTPLDYLYRINFSPDNQKFILYIFDHSQKYLIAQAIIFDNRLNVLSKGIAPIDNNFVNYGLHINNKGELFILNVDRVGRIALIKYNMETRDNIFLDISSSASKRYSFRLKFFNDDEVYVFNISSRSDKLSGVMYSKFNFKDKLIDKVNHHDLSEGMVQTSNVLRQNNKEYESSDDWMYYVISDVYLNAYEKIILVLEKQKIESALFRYESNAVGNLDNWYEKSGRVIAGPLLLYSFNADDVLLWETYCLKNQSNDFSSGLLSASYAMNITDAGKILMTYASCSHANGPYNEINYSEFEELSGSRIKNIKLENKEGLSMLKDYTVWFEDALILGTRKGLFGNKSFLVRYNLE